ncbi:MAG: DUF885 family protein, partial [Thermoanaerobaculia bacterium]|nr:DUF885 family protein [Thermoanaerobaculia bacterium]
MPPRRRQPAPVALLVSLALATACGGKPAPVEAYVERHFDTFPTRGLAAGRFDHAAELERLGPQIRSEWLAYNRTVAGALAVARRELALDPQELMDYELLERQARQQVLAFEDDWEPRHRPLFWTSLLSNATVFLLVRDEAPEAERLAAAAARAEQIPRLAATAREALAAGDPAEIAPEHAELAARQARASAGFYRGGFPAAGGDRAPSERLGAAGATAAQALDELAEWLEELAARAGGDFRLGERYAARFRVVTGVEEPAAEVARVAERALAEKRREAAAFGREVWPRWMTGAPPADDAELLRRLFDRVAEDRPTSTEELVADYRRLVHEAIEFAREHEVVTLPDPFRLWVGRSPPYFLGQSVGGVYGAGPYAPPGARTLLFLPTPPPDASAAARDALFVAFNDHFNRMITPHEVAPGHALQLAWAARHPRRVRALYGDGVTIEGWGTFVERLMLDLGWGDDLDRLAHLKKQLENIARTVVDVRVHTEGWGREEVERLVREEALQDPQLAANMWRRTMTSSPQLTFYFLGYREVWGLYEEARAAAGDDFSLRRFTDGMMELGP